MIPLTPRLLIAAAASFDGLRDAKGSNLSVMLARLATQLPHGRPDLSAAFVLHLGYQSHLDHESHASSWPLPLVACSKQLGEFARRKGILEDEPAEGDVFLVYDASKCGFVHTGVVVAVKERVTSPAGRPRFDCQTIEWVSQGKGTKPTPSVISTERRFYPDIGDRFIRWANLGAFSTGASRDTAAA